LVADLQRRIAEGRYHVPTERIVERLIGMLRAQTRAN
jgi:anti-sigma28 factor (negative regulator of flagellin synthesis)